MINAKFSDEDYARIMGKLKSVQPGRRSRVMFGAMKRVGIQLRNALVKNVSGKILKRRSGRLAQSIQSKVTAKGHSIGAEIGSGVRMGKRVPYADIHERGGVIRPKNAKYLTIPAKANQTATGQTRFTAPELFERFGSKMYFSGNALILKKGTKGTVMFYLKKKVKIPARRYLSRTLEEKQRTVVNLLLNGIRRGLN